MDIECKAGRHFNNSESAKECSKRRGGCDHCFPETGKETKSSKIDLSLNTDLQKKTDEHPILRCRKCSRMTLVKINENWYECAACKACGSSPESIETLETLYSRAETVEREQAPKLNPLQEIVSDAGGNPKKYASAKCPNIKCPSSMSGTMSLLLNDAGDKYYCINPDCPDYGVPISKITADTHNQQIIENKKTNDELFTKETKAWAGNQFIDSNKKKRVENGKSSHNFSGWYIALAVVLIFIVGLVFWGNHPKHDDLGAVITTTQVTNPTQNAIAPIAVPTMVTTSLSTTKVTTTSARINSYTGIYKNYYLGLVSAPDGNLIGGDGCYDDEGDFIVLINNENATNPSYDQMVNFLQNDTTDEYPYLYASVTPGSYYPPAENDVDLTRIKNIIDGTAQPSNPRVCSDFSERLHNDAEIAGIRCAYVSIDLSTGGHAIDAFQTTDRGLIYIDDTGPSQEPHALRAVKTVNLAVGSEFIPVSLFPESGWDATYDSTGTVIDFKVIWDGTWNNQIS
jgi:hypothetical protein